MNRRAITAVLCVAAILGAAPRAGAAQSQRFPDVPPDHYAFEAVEWAAQAGVTVGYEDGTFRPDEPLPRWAALVFMERYYDEILRAEQSEHFTRGDMMVLLKSINDGAAPRAGAAQGQRFPDVPPDHYAFEAVEWAARAGVTVGYEDGTFRPDEPLPRWAALVFMERYYDEILRAEQSEHFTRGDMMVLLKSINDAAAPRAAAEPASTYRSVSAGGAHSCAVRTDDTITCWGYNESGRADAPEGTYRSVSAGGAHSCAVRTDDTITCWGYNESGRADAPEGTYRSVSAGVAHSCAVRTDDTITCWGYNESGRADAPEGTYRSVSAGRFHSCAVSTDDITTCWFYPSVAAEMIIQMLPGPLLGTYRSVSVGHGYHSCAVRTDDTITCWGAEAAGRWRDDPPEGTYRSVSAGYLHSCAVSTDDTITCWGSYNEWGQHGQIYAPEGTYRSVSAGRGYSCAVSTDDTITCWGNNDYGQADAP